MVNDDMLGSGPLAQDCRVSILPSTEAAKSLGFVLYGMVPKSKCFNICIQYLKRCHSRPILLRVQQMMVWN